MTSKTIREFRLSKPPTGGHSEGSILRFATTLEGLTGLNRVGDEGKFMFHKFGLIVLSHHRAYSRTRRFL